MMSDSRAKQRLSLPRVAFMERRLNGTSTSTHAIFHLAAKTPTPREKLQMFQNWHKFQYLVDTLRQIVQFNTQTVGNGVPDALSLL